MREGVPGLLRDKTQPACTEPLPQAAIHQPPHRGSGVPLTLNGPRQVARPPSGAHRDLVATAPHR